MSPPYYKTDDELETFKTQINLSEYAAHLGFSYKKDKSTPKTVVMESPAGEVVLITKDKGDNRTWVYGFPNDENKRGGTVIQFHQWQTGHNLGQTRRALRPWVGHAASEKLFQDSAQKNFQESVKPKIFNAAKRTIIQQEMNKMRQIQKKHRYLNERKIEIDDNFHDRFGKRVFADRRNNAVFPHFDQAGICGYFKKNTEFAGFSSEGIKGLWVSEIEETDKVMVITESAIDSISYAILHGYPKDTFYVSTEGNISSEQLDYLKFIVGKLNKEIEVVIAIDNVRFEKSAKAKKNNKKMLEVLLNTLRAADKYISIVIKKHPAEHKDWNDLLKNKVPPVKLNDEEIETNIGL